MTLVERLHVKGAPLALEARAEILRLTAENFKLAAGQCLNVYGDEHGHPYCNEIAALKAELAQARKREVKVRWESEKESDCPRAFVGPHWVGSVVKRVDLNWNAYGFEWKKLIFDVDLTSARAAVEAEAFKAICGEVK